MILAGDAGGTKTVLALFSENKGKLVQQNHKRFISKDFPSIIDIIKSFLGNNDMQIDKACRLKIS